MAGGTTAPNVLTHDDERRLDELFQDLDVDWDWAFGLLTAVLAGPEVVTPDAWLGAIVGEHTAFVSGAAATENLGLLFRLYNDVASKIRTVPAVLCPKPDDHEAVARFCSGYVLGARMHDRWRKDEDAFLPVFVFAILAGEVEDELRDGEGNLIEDPEAWKQTHRERLSDYVTELHEYWRSSDAPLAGAEDVTKAKAGRNDPCPCGSGKKFKKCCGAS